MSDEAAGRDPRVDERSRSLWSVYHDSGPLGALEVAAVEIVRLEREVERLRAVCGEEATDAV